MSADTPIHVVTGSTGEYSDRSEWLVRAFLSRDAAEAFVTFLTVKRQELATQDYDINWEERDSVEKAMQAFDPGYHEDYAGTSWFISEVPLANEATA